MELVQQHLPPVLLQHVATVITGDDREGFTLVQLALDDAVVPLDLRLGRVGTLMGLEVQLTDMRVRDVASLEFAEEVAGRGILDARQPPQVMLTARHLVVDLAGAATTVARAIDEQCRIERSLRILL